MRKNQKIITALQFCYQPGEEAPIGLILCAGKKRETVEYLELGNQGIHVAEYLTELPPREVLQQRLHDAIIRARQRLAQAALDDKNKQK